MRNTVHDLNNEVGVDCTCVAGDCHIKMVMFRYIEWYNRPFDRGSSLRNVPNLWSLGSQDWDDENYPLTNGVAMEKATEFCMVETKSWTVSHACGRGTTFHVPTVLKVECKVDRRSRDSRLWLSHERGHFALRCEAPFQFGVHGLLWALRLKKSSSSVT